jgi:hypothetical protein
MASSLASPTYLSKLILKWSRGRGYGEQFVRSDNLL